LSKTKKNDTLKTALTVKNMKIKHLIITTTLLTILVVTGCQQKEEKVMPYPFKTAHIEYKIEGDVNGKMIVDIDNDYYANNIDVTEKETNTKQKLLKLDLKDSSYNIDLLKQTGEKSHNQVYNELKELKSNQEKLDKIITFAVGVKDKKPQSTGEKTIQGKKCEIYEISMEDKKLGEVCIWEGVPLYSNITIDGKQRKIEAIKIETGKNIDSSAFKIPENIKIKDLSATK